MSCFEHHCSKIAVNNNKAEYQFYKRATGIAKRALLLPFSPKMRAGEQEREGEKVERWSQATRFVFWSQRQAHQEDYREIKPSVLFPCKIDSPYFNKMPEEIWRQSLIDSSVFRNFPVLVLCRCPLPWGLININISTYWWILKVHRKPLEDFRPFFKITYLPKWTQGII